MQNEDTPLWMPSDELKENANLRYYLDWLKEQYALDFPAYDLLWKWSVTHPQEFWKSVWEYFRIQSYKPFETVLKKPATGMIGTKWFSGSTLNYAEHIFRNRSTDHPALIYKSESVPVREISWVDLERSVSGLAAFLKNKGVRPGDRVVSTLPNIPETVMAFLATNSIGAIWSSCSPDFGHAGITDRFTQIEPKILFAPDGYRYNGKVYDRVAELKSLRESLPTLESVVLVPVLGSTPTPGDWVNWNDAVSTEAGPLAFEPVPFEHPIWVLYSSGTTGKPKAITHSMGGCLLEHLKALVFHQNVKPGERYFWYSTTGWMMWNFSVASLLAGATLVLYDGSASHPDLRTLWTFAKEAGINHFGGGAAYFSACSKIAGLLDDLKLPALKTIGSTGSPLSDQAFEWIYQAVKKDVWLISFSGGTDICSGFVGGCPFLPVYKGEIQCRLLGCYLEAFDMDGKPVRNELGEMVILEPMPSMPVFFWNDPGYERYHASYFENYPDIWRHGDWIMINDRGGVIIYGRSDATLNRDGVRIGTSEIYSVVEGLPEIADSLVVCIEKPGDRFFMPLFVVLKNEYKLTEELTQKIKKNLRSQYSPRHVPDAIIQVNDVPYTLSGKKMEMPVKKILMGMSQDKAVNKDTMKNPESLNEFVPYQT